MRAVENEHRPHKSCPQAALEYFDLGWAPIPLHIKSKNPNREGWPKERWTPEQIKKQASSFGNVGVLMGKPSQRLVDVDLDCQEAIAMAPRFLPPTGAIFGRASKRRSHYLYVLDEPIDSSEFKDLDGSMLVEARSTGRQTVFPPSTHPSGELTEWDRNGKPGTIAAVVLQFAVTQLAAASLLVRHWPEQGSRHDASLYLAGVLIGQLHWSIPDAADFIEAVCVAAGDEEAQQRRKNVETTAKQVARGKPVRGGRTLGEIIGEDVVDRFWRFFGVQRHDASSSPSQTDSKWSPPVEFHEIQLPSFPTHVLSPWQRDFVRAVALQTQTPEDLAALMTLGATGAALAGKVEVRIDAGWCEPANIYVAAALASGNRKSPVVRRVLRPVHEFEQERVEASRTEIAKAMAQRTILEDKVTRARHQVAQAKTTDEQEAAQEELITQQVQLGMLEPPVQPRFLAENATPEKLSSLMAEQGGRMAILSDEGDVFDLMAGRYSKHGGPNLEIYLKGHDGSPVRVDRIGREAEFIERPLLTIAVSPQPSVLQGLARHSEFRGRGLLARFLYSLPESLLGSRDNNPPLVPEAVQVQYNTAMRKLLELAVPKNEHGVLLACELQMSSEARETLRAFETWLEPQLGEFGELGAMNDWAGKLTGAVARIAGLLHVADQVNDPQPWPTLITVETVERAIQIGKYLIPHAKAVFALMGADPAIEDAKHLLHWIDRHGRQPFTQRDIFDATKSRFKTVGGIEPALNLLVKQGYIREQRMEREGQRGRPPGPTFEVNPLWAEHKSHK